MSRTITCLFDSPGEAASAIADLEAAGIGHNAISLIAGEGAAPASDAADGASQGFVVGELLGGGAGLLAGVAGLAIPGLGPLVGVGWLAAGLVGALGGGVAGAAAGGLAGALTHHGIDAADAERFDAGVAKGGCVVGVKAQADEAGTVEAILDRRGGVRAAA